MRMLRCLLAVSLLCCLPGVARANGIFFQAQVVDPTVPFDLLQDVTTDSFAVTFPTTGPAAGCQPSQLSGISDPSDYTACFTGINLTGGTLTQLTISFPTFTYGGGTASPSCPNSAGADNAFSSVSCTIVGGDYVLSFSGGDIPSQPSGASFCFLDSSFTLQCSSPSIFTIAFGIPGVNLVTSGLITEDFNDVSAVANTPEPNSAVLTSTGVFSIALFAFAYRRKQALLEPGPTTATYSE